MAMVRFGDTILNILGNYKRCLGILIKIDKKFLAFSLFSTVLLGITPSISLLLTQSIINGIQTGVYSFSQVVGLIIVYVACNALVSLFTIFSQYYTSVFQYKLNKTINIMILDKAGKLSFKSFENPEAYNKIQRAQTSNKIYPFISYILSIIQLSITFISYGAIILSWKWWSIFLILPNACFSTFLANRLNKKRYEMLRYRAEEERKKWYFQYLLTNDIAFKEIRTYNLAEYFIHKVKGIYDDFFKQDKSYYKKSSEISLLISILDELCMGVLFCIVIFDTYAGNILIGDSVAYINVSSNIKSTLKQLLAQISAIYNDNLYINQIFEFLDMPEEEQIKRMEKHIDEINTITVENLSYRYNSNNRYALKDVSFSLSKGDIVAIVGKNGAGKSTLAKILSVLYNDYEGSIRINGIEMRQIDKDQLRKKISILFQDFTKYELSLGENIGISDIDNLSNCDKQKRIIESIGLNMDLELTQQLGNWFENGKNLSGGQWIKVGIGRVLFKDAELIILDEPNAALDAISEINIFKAIKQIAKNRICIVITHRVSNVPFYADKVMVIDEGKVVGFETHDYLLKNCHIYNELYTADLKIANRE